jgi:hypothetical protein
VVCGKGVGGLTSAPELFSDGRILSENYQKATKADIVIRRPEFSGLPKWNAILQATLYCCSVKLQEIYMLKKSLIISGTLLFACPAFAQSGTTPGASNSAPGQQMHDAKKSTAPGASEYAPGHKMQDAKKSTAPGASEYAPGHQTTGSSGGMKK